MDFKELFKPEYELTDGPRALGWLVLQGRRLELKVQAKDPELLKQFLENCRLAFDVLPPDENAKQWDEPPDADMAAQDGLETPEVDPEQELSIDLDVTEAPGLEPPYDLFVTIDPSLGLSQSHTYRTKKQCTKEKITLKASVNGVTGRLTGGGMTPITKQAGVSPIGSHTAKFTGQSAAASNFDFTVTGMGAENTYSINASIKLVG